MTGKQRRAVAAPAALLPTLVVLGLLVLVWAATTGPVRMLRESGRRVVFGDRSPPTATATDEPTTGNLREVTRGVRQQADLSWVGDLVATAALAGVCLVGFLALRWMWLHRWRRPATPEEVEFDVLPDRLVDALRRDVGAQLGAVEQGSPRNGIVACWLRLQEIVSDAGLPPQRSETAAEFVVRTLRALDLDPRAVGSLAALYREARFSEHEIDEERRTAARTALRTLHDDLHARGAVS